jgi:crotonobetainyl-CoA:carnitine CoA-transferase CaiB-like acyl-CoA transferase
MTPLPYSGLRVVEIGSRTAVGACGRLLADLGASVHILEPRVPRASRPGKWHDRTTAVAGKESILYDAANPDDRDEAATLISDCDVVVLSTDADGEMPEVLRAFLPAHTIECDITAFGSTGPLSKHYADEHELQGLTGITETTGHPDGPATPVGAPVLEMSAALYAAGGIAAALHVLRRDGVPQSVEVALYDVGINALTTFMPAFFAGLQPRRLGNGHAMAVPWNAYPAADGWIVICSTNDAQWRRIAGLVGPDLAQDPRLAELKARLSHRAEIDARIADWAQTMPLVEVARQLGELGIPCGSIVTVDRLEAEPNLALRGVVLPATNQADGASVRVPGSFIRFDGEDAPVLNIPTADSGRGKAALGAQARPITAGAALPRHAQLRIAAPLAGLRVVEIGQLTTAPLAARHLASLGADVIKVEPPEGESARHWAPLRDGVSHFFVASNGEKRSMTVDLRSESGARSLAELLSNADVLVENMKPGSLARLGFGADQLARINPRLIYCAVSGFGARSAYEGRPAVDTVVQAMSGMMDATRSNGVPLKTGISAADIAGGEAGLLAIIAGLARRERTGRGCLIDISMQDVGAWMTQALWNRTSESPSRACAVLSVADACMHPQTIARELILERFDTQGRRWQVFGSPIRLARTPAQVGTLIGEASALPLRWRPVPDQPGSDGSAKHAQHGRLYS